MHNIVINDVTYSNVGNIEEDIEYEYYYDVTALSGKKYQDVRYTKTNYVVSFFNLIDGVYKSLETMIRASAGTPIRCGIPTDEGFKYNEYYIKISNPGILKGYLNGVYYRTGLTLKLEAVNKDE